MLFYYSSQNRVSYQLSVISYQLSVISYQLSVRVRASQKLLTIGQFCDPHGHFR
ncbi:MULTISPECIES: hypothetical protein [unclassified Microcystis]|uniref:hypothetical protein n=1 Tax=unclassified Microcystis TaxID=2643300 RepID=UPI0025888C44|nr:MULTISPECIES: hypothetical protein [unclassified Microcystis]MCA2530923.1 hypothetical protein [Microcystis sp. M51BS1]MCA2559800.1 hypothetical protein [Microcystis sp. M43BS1]MCA2565385.1 hypothetical protein [Microcystis sp. M44BS1]MCA2588216.1 hypothetical protein [Microcystis sp. M34BS1]